MDRSDEVLRNTAVAHCHLDGGLNTPWAAVRRGLPAATVLATVGVAGTDVAPKVATLS